MKEHISRSFLEANDYEKLEKLADKIGTIFDGYWARGGYTEEAFHFFDFYKKKAATGSPEGYYDALIDIP